VFALVSNVVGGSYRWVARVSLRYPPFMAHNGPDVVLVTRQKYVNNQSILHNFELIPHYLIDFQKEREKWGGGAEL